MWKSHCLELAQVKLKNSEWTTILLPSSQWVSNMKQMYDPCIDQMNSRMMQPGRMMQPDHDPPIFFRMFATLRTPINEFSSGPRPGVHVA
jgi:hypothetical protein